MKEMKLMILLILVLLTAIAKAQTEEMNRVKVTVANIFKKEIEVYDKKNNLKGIPKNIIASDDRIEFTIKRQKTILIFSSLFDSDVSFKSVETTGTDGKTTVKSNELQLKDCVLYFRLNYEDNKQMHHDLSYVAQERERNRYTSQLLSFEPIAEEYRSLKIKPTVPEEQRKYIVQANGYNEQKMYDKAIELYKKAIEVNSTSFPSAYSNMALLTAQINHFNAAIYYMKKYLMLEPEASDARSAQDKIYLWETQIIQ